MAAFERWYNLGVRRVQRGETVVYESDALAMMPGRGVFTTRHGGVSPPPFDSLNLSASVGDDPANVEENWARLHRSLDLNSADTVDASQAQGGKVALVSAGQKGTRIAKVDALVTNLRGIPLMLRFADCVPVLFFDPVHGAIGIAHAGWRGTVAKVTATTIQAMQEAFGSEPREMRACIGPSIGPCCYVVGQDVRALVEEAFPEAGGLLIRRNGGVYFDLWAANERLLRDLGIGEIEVAGMCTSDHTEDFFSWRREHAHTGRLAAVIALNV